MEEISTIINLNRLVYMAIIAMGLWMLIIMAVLLDLWAGVRRARSMGEYIYSGGFRLTFKKVSEYWMVLMMCLLVDTVFNFMPWFNLPYVSMLGTLGVILIEGRSVIENLRIKKSHAAEIPGAAKQIIACKDIKNALKLLEDLKNGR